MSSTSDILAKWQELRNRGFDLGGKQDTEQDAGSGGRVQVYERGRIYWHPNTGAHEVHGGILMKYLSLHGPGVNPATGRRDLGYPTTDESRTSDNLYPVSHFEFGSIIWGPVGTSGGVSIWGDFRSHWENINDMSRPQRWGWELGALGYPISDPILRNDGETAYFQSGCLWRGPASNNTMVTSSLGKLPRLCRPTLVDPASPIASRLGGLFALGQIPVPKAVFDANAGPLRLLLGRLWSDLFLRQVTKAGEQRQEIRILGGVAGSENSSAQGTTLTDILSPAPAGPAGPTPLKERALYDVVLSLPTGATYVMSHHAFYVKKAWDNFGFIHATDLHVSRRLDGFHRKLRELGLDDGAREFSNCNDNFRSLVRHANELYDVGAVDFILATGDLVDYVFEADDNRLAGGNFRFLEQLILGQVPFVTGTPTEELRVPIFTTLGNHDYRPNPYTLDFDVGVSVEAADALPGLNLAVESFGELFGTDIDPDIGFITLHRERISKQLNLNQDEGKALQNGHVPRLDVSSTADRQSFLRQVAPDQTNETGSLNYYFARLVGMDRRAIASQYTVRLGPHRIVMLDSGWDLGIPASADTISTVRLIEEYLTGLSEDRAMLLGGAPNLNGVTERHLREVRIAIQDAHGTGGPDPQGLVIVGVHAPLLNPHKSELPHYFRETEHPTAHDEETLEYLLRSGGVPGAIGPTPNAAKAAGWELTGTPHFKRGSVTELLDSGIAKGKVEELLKLCVGQGATGKVDLVLCGHHHDRAEFRLGWDAGGKELLYHMDFYTENPREYYRSNKKGRGSVHIQVKSGAPLNGSVVTVHDHKLDAFWKEWTTLSVPPHPAPLSTAPDARAWWARHRPLVIQTGPWGPIDQNLRKDRSINPTKPGPDFQGIRVVSVQNNAIRTISYATRLDLEKQQVIGATATR